LPIKYSNYINCKKNHKNKKKHRKKLKLKKFHKKIEKFVFLQKLLVSVADQFASSLPPYAIPVFLRVCSADLDRTGTFKLKKVGLQRDGFSVAACAPDPVFVWHSAQRRFIPLTATTEAAIDGGRFTGI
jgi:hypothetical protein